MSATSPTREVGRLFYRCDRGCDTFGVEKNVPCMTCDGGLLSKLATQEEYVAALEAAEAHDATLDLVSILATFKAALEDLNNRVSVLEDYAFPPPDDSDEKFD